MLRHFDADAPVTVRVFCDYGCYPLWVRAGEDMLNVAGEELGLDAALVAALGAWNDEFQRS